MSNLFKKLKETNPWNLVIIYTVFIYISLPIIPIIRQYVEIYLGEKFIDYIILTLLAIFIFSLLAYFLLKAKKQKLTNYLFISVIIFIYIYLIKLLSDFPVERFHLIEYSLLGILVYRALEHSIKGKTIYLWVSSIVFVIGLIDEIIQYVLPNRVYGTRDVIINGISGILGLVIAKTISASKNQRKVGLSTVDLDKIS